MNGFLIELALAGCAACSQSSGPAPLGATPDSEGYRPAATTSSQCCFKTPPAHSARSVSICTLLTPP